MNHQPFETWLLSDQALTSDQAEQLEEHLLACVHCRGLREAWDSVEALFQDAPDLDPAPGFVQRWENRLRLHRQDELAMRHRWQSWISLILIANLVSFLAVILGLQFFSTYNSLTQLLLIWVYRVTSLLTAINVVQNFLAILLHVLPGLLSPSGWAALAMLLSGASLLWVLWISRLAKIPRRT
jgi:hypothetical protein